MKEADYRCPTLPYRNTLVGNDLVTYLPTVTKASNVFLYSKLIAGRNRTCVCLFSEAFLPLEDREFPRVITSQHGCYRPIALTIEKHTRLPLQPCSCQFRKHLDQVQRIPLVVCICQFRLAVCFYMLSRRPSLQTRFVSLGSNPFCISAWVLTFEDRLAFSFFLCLL